MKKTLLILTLCILGYSATYAVDPIVDQDSTTITFNETIHDYGIIIKGSDGSCTFTFTNTGEKPLVLLEVKTSCGCTTPYWTKEPIAPGETGVIKIKYDTNRIGVFNKTITVLSNAPSIVLQIKGTVKVEE